MTSTVQLKWAVNLLLWPDRSIGFSITLWTLKFPPIKWIEGTLKTEWIDTNPKWKRSVNVPVFNLSKWLLFDIFRAVLIAVVNGIYVYFQFLYWCEKHTYKVDYTEIVARPQIQHAVSLTLCYSPVCFAAVSTGSPAQRKAPHVVHEK